MLAGTQTLLAIAALALLALAAAIPALRALAGVPARNGGATRRGRSGRARPAAPDEHELRLARTIVEHHGADSLSPFLVAPRKALSFAAGGVLSYRVIGETAVVSADPVAPGDAAVRVLESFARDARANGWRVAVWAASDRHLDDYRALGLRAICVGEEAVVDPSTFTLEGRPVRKLRQSVHRVSRRGWRIEVLEGREIDSALEAEIELLEGTWRSERTRIHGFAMGNRDAPEAPAPGRRLRARSLARGHARRRDAVRLAPREAVARHDAPSRRDAERAQRGAGLPRRSRSRASAGARGQPQLRRAGTARARRRGPAGSSLASQRGWCWRSRASAFSWTDWCASTRSSRRTGGRAISSTSHVPGCRGRSCACSRPRATCPQPRDPAVPTAGSGAPGCANARSPRAARDRRAAVSARRRLASGARGAALAVTGFVGVVPLLGELLPAPRLRDGRVPPPRTAPAGC